jgi:diadenosine tetraphosphatase ApaH/serine/threonine PP2A family protein phosphatase
LTETQEAVRIAIVSDVHANLEALVEVERAIADLAVDQVACLGDVVGYGASPNECCDILRRMASVALLGNHVAAVAGRMDYAFYYDAARHALDWTARHLRPDNLAWLGSLPYTHRIGEVGFSHGSPIHPETYDYILASEQAGELLPFVDQLPQVTFIGHSHLTKVFALKVGSEVVEVSGRRFRLRPDYKYVVTVGAVGQPRDYDNRACFVVHDTEERTVEYVRVPYDIETSAQRIFAAKVAVNFGRRLFLGV